MSGDRPAVFVSYTLDELMRLDDTDLNQTDALHGAGPEWSALWWNLRRMEWAEQEGGTDVA
jgi:hypothetical protein